MNINRTELSALANFSKMEEVVKEAYKYGMERGQILGRTPGDSKKVYREVESDYLSKKFGISGDLEKMADDLSRVPIRVLKQLRAGFDVGYSKANSGSEL